MNPGRASAAMAVSALALGLVACAGRTRPPSPCAKDTDCKGARVCQAGACVDPTPVGGPGPVQPGGDGAWRRRRWSAHRRSP
jgi:hypothetical protein